jgi:hypothetical protein
LVEIPAGKSRGLSRSKRIQQNQAQRTGFRDELTLPIPWFDQDGQRIITRLAIDI